MTNLEVILSYPAVSELHINQVSKSCIDRGVNQSSEYASSEKSGVEIVIADCLVAVVNLPDFSQGDLSEKYDREALLANANALYRNNGIVVSNEPTITARNIW